VTGVENVAPPSVDRLKEIVPWGNWAQMRSMLFPGSSAIVGRLGLGVPMPKVVDKSKGVENEAPPLAEPLST
jgi:hypothetical protein